MAEQAAGDTQGKMKRLSREMRNLLGKTALPVHMASSVFVRHDSDRMDKVRAMITGMATPLSSLMYETKIDCFCSFGRFQWYMCCLYTLAVSRSECDLRPDWHICLWHHIASRSACC